MRKKTRNEARKAFTMVELMAVLIILGLLATVAVRAFMGQIDRARVVTTTTSLKNLHNAVLQFKMDTGRYPSEDEGLWELVEEPTDVPNWNIGGYLDTTDIPLDAWSNDFIYLLDPGTGKRFVIISNGADGQEGGEGYDADIHSTDSGQGRRRESEEYEEYEEF